MITLKTKVRRKSDVASRNIAGEVIILSAKDSMLHSLDEVGSVIWDLLKEPRTAEEIVSALLDQYQVDRATLEKDVLEFLNTLLERKLIATAE